jgi:hypothetical protein
MNNMGLELMTGFDFSNDGDFVTQYESGIAKNVKAFQGELIPYPEKMYKISYSSPFFVHDFFNYSYWLGVTIMSLLPQVPKPA